MSKTLLFARNAELWDRKLWLLKEDIGVQYILDLFYQDSGEMDQIIEESTVFPLGLYRRAFVICSRFGVILETHDALQCVIGETSNFYPCGQLPVESQGIARETQKAKQQIQRTQKRSDRPETAM